MNNLVASHPNSCATRIALVEAASCIIFTYFIKKYLLYISIDKTENLILLSHTLGNDCLDRDNHMMCRELY